MESSTNQTRTREVCTSSDPETRSEARFSGRFGMTSQKVVYIGKTHRFDLFQGENLEKAYIHIHIASEYNRHTRRRA